MTINRSKLKKANIYNNEVQLKMHNAKKYRKERNIKSEKNGTKILYRIPLKKFLQ
jgi:hypothetical protein